MSLSGVATFNAVPGNLRPTTFASNGYSGIFHLTISLGSSGHCMIYGPSRMRKPSRSIVGSALALGLLPAVMTPLEKAALNNIDAIPLRLKSGSTMSSHAH
ncbi:MAG: hypothetical protein ACOYX1_05070 [Acidobacteriota bacterium]